MDDVSIVPFWVYDILPVFTSNEESFGVGLGLVNVLGSLEKSHTVNSYNSVVFVTQRESSL